MAEKLQDVLLLKNNQCPGVNLTVLYINLHYTTPLIIFFLNKACPIIFNYLLIRLVNFLRKNIYAEVIIQVKLSVVCACTLNCSEKSERSSKTQVENGTCRINFKYIHMRRDIRH